MKKLFSALLLASAALVGGASSAQAQRTIDLTAPGFFYVDPATGSDTGNTCMASGTPCATIAHALYVVEQDVDCQGYYPYIVVAPGSTVTEQIGVYGTLVGADEVFFITNPADIGNLDNENPDDVTWIIPSGGTAIQARDNGIATVAGFHFETEAGGSGARALNPSQNGTIDFMQDDFGSMPDGWDVFDDIGGSANALGPFTISGTLGSGGAPFYIGSLAKLVLQGDDTISMPNPISFYAFFQGNPFSVVSMAPDTTFSGAGAGTGSTGMPELPVSDADYSLSGNTIPGNSPNS